MVMPASRSPVVDIVGYGPADAGGIVFTRPQGGTPRRGHGRFEVGRLTPKNGTTTVILRDAVHADFVYTLNFPCRGQQQLRRLHRSGLSLCNGWSETDGGQT